MKPSPLFLGFFLIALLAAAGAGFAAPTKGWNQGDPSAEEQYVLEQFNAARKDPVAFAARFYALLNADPTVTGYVAFRSGTASLVTAQTAWIQRELASLQARYETAQRSSVNFPNSGAISNAPLVFYPAFQAQASRWNSVATANPIAVDARFPLPAFVYPVPNVGPSSGFVPGYITQAPFSGPNATGGTAQFGPFGANNYRTLGAHFYAPYVGAREWVLELGTSADLIGQGESLPGFRLGNTRMAGIKIKAGNADNRILTFFQASSEFLTQSDLPFGNVDTVFITGVIYQDKNSNGLYDLGEGLGGTTVMPDKGDWFAVSSTSGGFSFPVRANTGAYILTLTTGQLQGATATVDVGVVSVKNDWVLPADPSTLPPQVTVAPSTGVSQFTGLSTRGIVETGANSLFGGFVIANSNATRKRVLVRAVGDTLNLTFGLRNAVGATSVSVFDSSGALLASNTGWRSTADFGAAVQAAADSVGLFRFAAEFDSALIVDLPAGGYTAVFRSADPNPQAGRIGLLEVYDLTPGIGGRFIALSTRGRIDTGDRKMIVGCSLAGTGSKRMLVRGVGAELGAVFGVPGALPNPTLTLFDNAGAVLAVNDDWSNSPQTNQVRSLTQASGAFSLSEGNPDASLLRLIGPGNYTAAVEGRTGTLNNGVAIVELYETP